MRRAPIPQEAVIGIVYAVCAAAAVLVVDRAPQGSEHIKQLLVGHILTVSGVDVARLAVGYALIGGLHWLVLGDGVRPPRSRAWRSQVLANRWTLAWELPAAQLAAARAPQGSTLTSRQ